MKPHAGIAGAFLPGPVVVAGDDQFVAMGETSEPLVEAFDLPGVSVVTVITGMDQQVTIRDLHMVVQGMGIRKTDNPWHRGIAIL
jgi:hypothetical protein